MRALVKAHAEPGLWLQDVPEPELGINDVLIKVDRTGICGTDVHIYQWDDWARKTIPVPMVVGHEFVGEVAEVGANVADFKPGDVVSGEGHITCGHCRHCLAGQRHLCPKTQGVGVNRAGEVWENNSLFGGQGWQLVVRPDPSLRGIAGISATQNSLGQPVVLGTTGAGDVFVFDPASVGSPTSPPCGDSCCSGSTTTARRPSSTA